LCVWWVIVLCLCVWWVIVLCLCVWWVIMLYLCVWWVIMLYLCVWWVIVLYLCVCLVSNRAVSVCLCVWCFRVFAWYWPVISQVSMSVNWIVRTYTINIFRNELSILTTFIIGLIVFCTLSVTGRDFLLVSVLYHLCFIIGRVFSCVLLLSL
jgi:hypothetical protein